MPFIISGPQYHGLRSEGLQCQLHGTAYPVAAEHDPDLAGDTVPMVFEIGAGGLPISQAVHRNHEAHVRVAVEGVTSAEYAEYLAIVKRVQTRHGETVDYSPLGETAYTSSGWLLISTNEGWVRTDYDRWSGVLELVKKGATL